MNRQFSTHSHSRLPNHRVQIPRRGCSDSWAGKKSMLGTTRPTRCTRLRNPRCFRMPCERASLPAQQSQRNVLLCHSSMRRGSSPSSKYNKLLSGRTPRSNNWSRRLHHWRRRCDSLRRRYTARDSSRSLYTSHSRHRRRPSANRRRTYRRRGLAWGLA